MSKPITRKQHGLTDYLFVPVVFFLPAIVGFYYNETAANLCMVFAVLVLGMALMTRAEWGVMKLIPFRLHLAMDVALGIFSIAAPWVLGFSDDTGARNTFIVLGLVAISAGLMSRPEEMHQESHHFGLRGSHGAL